MRYLLLSFGMNMQYKQQVISRFCLFCLLLAAQSTAYASDIKCWINKQGVRECGAMVPPEYAQQRVEVINDKGLVIKVYPRARTPKELKAARQAALEKKQAEQRKVARKRQDVILLRTFTTERDIEMSRMSKVDAIKGIIDITNSNTRTLQNNLQGLQKKAADYERSGEKAPLSLVDDMNNLQGQIKDNDSFVTKKQQAIIRLEKKYDTDLERFRELKRVRPH